MPGNPQASADWFSDADLTADGAPATAPTQGAPHDDGPSDGAGPHDATLAFAPTDGAPPDAVPQDDLVQDDLVQDDLLRDAAWDRPPVRNRLTTVLLVAVLVVGGFTGGIAFQRQRGGDSRTAGGFPTAGALPGGGAFPSGGAFPGGGFPGGAQSLPGSASGASAGASGASTNPLGGGTSTAADLGSAPVVVGTIASVRTASITVQNFAGKNVTVQVPSTAKVTTSGLVGLAAGSTVAVVGTAAADGTVTATAITVTASK